MQKISTLFMRDPRDRRRLTRQVHRHCQWVLDGEGVALRKYDGACVVLDDQCGHWWARLEVRPPDEPPPNFYHVATDSYTGILVGLEPIAQSPYAAYFDEAIGQYGGTPEPGTYELIGPQINGNPENVPSHCLISHAQVALLDNSVRTYDALRRYLAELPYEGIVWRHPDGRMAKIKRRDIMDAPPVETAAPENAVSAR